MESRWVNLYGVSLEERIPGTPQSNSSFMGRILLSLHFTENDRPQFQSQGTQNYTEPLKQKYQLWIDLFDLTNCDGILTRSSVWVTASIGAEISGEQYATVNQQNKQGFIWKSKKKSSSIEVEFPQDLSQVPDIFINLYATTTLGGEERVGFVRLQA